jgi:hypothetical protein
MPPPSASARGWAPDPNTEEGRSAAAAICRRDSRTSCREPDGAAITTRWPRAIRSSEIRATYSFTSWRELHGCGVTCAISSPSEAATGAA